MIQPTFHSEWEYYQARKSRDGMWWCLQRLSDNDKKELEELDKRIRAYETFGPPFKHLINATSGNV